MRLVPSNQKLGPTTIDGKVYRRSVLASVVCGSGTYHVYYLLSRKGSGDLETLRCTCGKDGCAHVKLFTAWA